MDATLQKITVIFSVLIISFISTATQATQLSKCSTGKLLVAQKQVGTASYFAEDCKKSWKNQSIKMDFFYTQNIPEWAFKRAATYFIKRNISNQQTITALNEITQLYSPVKSGDLYQLNYMNNTKTLSLFLNQKKLGQLQHPYAIEYFNIWLGPQPFNDTLKHQLLNSR